jgi:hypothetical protein
MRGVALRAAVVISLAVMLGGQVSELFDHWDNTLRTGGEADYSLVLVAACAGLACAVGPSILARFTRLRVKTRSHVPEQTSLNDVLLADFVLVTPTGPSPPGLTSLRI